ncbi:hypothetical protein Ahy_B06g085995 isoform C [Arachis hypogaea]|uniref:Uncharacterized protein n=1 Tax=Arachis hypogaea TaxID=3818 RepID=A0A444YWF9_ARAHY|nr:hypothetical protein Ahy_B06g085995 isoform C [Arachis hypogaea]
MDAYDGTVRLGAINLKQHDLRAGAAGEFDSGPDVSVSSPVTRQKAAAAKQFIENHYKNYLQGLQDRKDRRFFPPEAEGSRTLYAILTEFFPPQCIKKFLSRDIVNRDEPTFKKHLLGLRWMALQWKKRPVNGPYGSYLKIKKKLRIAQKKLRRMRFMHQVHRMRPIRGVRSEPCLI